MNNQIFINLPVEDLERSKRFYTALGFNLNPQFSDEKAACMAMSEAIFVMLLTKPFFQTFTSKSIADTASSVEVLNSLLSAEKTGVDDFLKKAIEGGGRQSREVRDQGFMYDVAVEDPDGHIWEMGWMDMSAFGTGEHMPQPEAAQS